MASTSYTPKKITLKSSDNETFELDEAVAMELKTIKLLIDDGFADTVIPVANVTGKILSKVIEYCKKHLGKCDFELKAWDKDFVDVDQTTLFHLVLAANYLEIKGLLDLTCFTMANMMKDKTPEEIHEKFNIKNDFTPEEEAELRRENAWAFEDYIFLKSLFDA